MMNYIRSVGTLMLVGVLTSIAQADLFLFNVSLNGSQEVPANASPGTGVATAMFDDSSGAISITGSYSGLLGNVNNAHLHGFAGIGTNAGVLFGLSHTGGTTGTFNGNGVISAGNIPNVLNGLTYINIHSVVFPGGEIRGQLTNPIQIPEPDALLLIGAGLGGIVFRRRRTNSVPNTIGESPVFRIRGCH